MSLFVLDTDHLSLYQVGHPQILRNIARHVHHSLAVTVVTVEEHAAAGSERFGRPVTTPGANTFIVVGLKWLRAWQTGRCCPFLCLL